MISSLHRLHLLTGDARYEDHARKLEDVFSQRAAQNPFAHGSMLASLEEAPAMVQAVIFADGSPANEFVDAVLELPVAEPVIFYATQDHSLPIGHPAHGKTATTATLYLCRGATCSLPVTLAADLPAAWASLA